MARFWAFRYASPKPRHFAARLNSGVRCLIGASLSPVRILLFTLVIAALAWIGMKWRFSRSTLPAPAPELPFFTTRSTGLAPLPDDVREFVQGLCPKCQFAGPLEPCTRADAHVQGMPYRCVVSISNRGSVWTVTYDKGSYVPTRNVMVIETQPKIGLIKGTSCPFSQSATCDW